MGEGSDHDSFLLIGKKIGILVFNIMILIDFLTAIDKVSYFLNFLRGLLKPLTLRQDDGDTLYDGWISTVRSTVLLRIPYLEIPEIEIQITK